MTGCMGLLAVTVDPAPNHQDELNAWYDTEHLPERREMPGFRSALRFVAVDGGPRYLAVYDLDSVEALNSAEYRAVSGPNFSAWTRRVTTLSKTHRMVARQTTSDGRVTGPCSRLLMLRFGSGAAGELALIEEGLRLSFAGKPAVGQYRTFLCEDPDPTAVLAMVEVFGNTVPPLQIDAFSGAARLIELATTYQRY